MEVAKGYPARVYRPSFYAEFPAAAREPGSALVPWVGASLQQILREHPEHTLGHDNCVRFAGREAVDPG